MSLPRPRPLPIALLGTGLLLGLGAWGWWLRAARAPDPGPLPGVAAPAPGQVHRPVPLPPGQELANPDDVLSLAERQYVWDIEHLGFVLEQKVFPDLQAAFASGDPARLRAYLADEFQGTLPTRSARRLEFTDGPVRFEKEIVSGAGQSRACGRDEFLSWVTAFRQRFGSEVVACKAGLGLVRLHPLTRGDFLGAWRTVWRLRLAGQGPGGRPVEAFIWLECELNHLSEETPQRRRWIRAARVIQWQAVQAEEFLLADITPQSGIETARLYDNWRQGCEFQANTGGVYVCDYDADAHLDLLVTDMASGAWLYRGRGDGTFEETTQAAGLSALRTEEPLLWATSAVGDLDGDGDEDFLIQDRLFENRGDGTFAEVTAQTNLALVRAAGYALADYDLDGRVDLYVCHSGPYRAGQVSPTQVSWIDGSLGVENVLWRNLGNWQFEDVTDQVHAGGGGMSCFSAVWLYANADRYPDLFAINEFGRNALLLSQPDGKFQRLDIDPVFGGFSMGVTAGDFDNDGRTDLYVANMYSKAGNRVLSNVDPASYPPDLYRKINEATLGSKLYVATGDDRFRVVPPDETVADVGWAYGASFLDLNGDGWQDLYATAGFRSVQRGKPDG